MVAVVHPIPVQIIPRCRRALGHRDGASSRRKLRSSSPHARGDQATDGQCHPAIAAGGQEARRPPKPSPFQGGHRSTPLLKVRPRATAVPNGQPTIVEVSMGNWAQRLPPLKRFLRTPPPTGMIPMIGRSDLIGTGGLLTAPFTMRRDVSTDTSKPRPQRDSRASVIPGGWRSPGRPWLASVKSRRCRKRTWAWPSTLTQPTYWRATGSPTVVRPDASPSHLSASHSVPSLHSLGPTYCA